MKVNVLLSTVLVLTLTLAACAPQAAPTKKASVPAAVPPLTKPTSAPAQSGSATPTTTTNTTSATAVPQGSASTPAASATQGAFALPTPGPAFFNDISVNDQAISSGSVIISMVDSMQPGWVAIFSDDNGQPGKLLGYVAVPKGTSEDIRVNVDAGSANGKMIAMLLKDAGKIGTFEYPGPDEPVKNANINENVLAIFNRISQ
jgi:hypothetical protein